MGYLNNSEIVVDAILTRKGRELLAKGKNEFNITHFALADDEIDYTLWNADHPFGSQYYGIVIENMPITEAVPDETQVMKYKLVTLPKQTIRIPVVSVAQNNINLTPGQSTVIKPETVNYTEGNSTYGYTAIVADSDVVTIEVVEPAQGTTSYSPAPGISSQAISVVGKAFLIKARSAINVSKNTTVTIYGNETGGQTVVKVHVEKIEG